VGAVTLVLGGARSGKSAVAEELLARQSPPVTYVATGRATDDDMAARIAAHRDRRPSAWATVEATGPALPAVLRDLEGAVLLDALGTWLASDEHLDVDGAALCAALVERPGATVVVSDEVGLGVHPASEVGRRFRDALGTLNQQVAGVADDVFLVVAGRVLPLPRP
jgi:adenosylcobinamide kinase / adenosylcobinamide-phosphate guanylyltransferase